MAQNFGNPQPPAPVIPPPRNPFLGTFLTASAIPLTGALAGDYADVDSGVGSNVERYIYDVNDNKFVKSNTPLLPTTVVGVQGQSTTSAISQKLFTDNASSVSTALASKSDGSTTLNQRDGLTYKEWIGTQAQYDAIVTKDTRTKYLVKK